jgi:predicted 3-demethylubiquinone-9 3-methyltransferase (glyoxalase superfamily)
MDEELTTMTPKNTICLWFDKDAHDAARFDGGAAASGSEAKRAFEAMMTMQKIEVATIEAARRG